MLKVDDLLNFPSSVRKIDKSPEMDPLCGEDALLESCLLGLSIDAHAGVAGVLFDLRTGFGLEEGNTGVLVMGGVRAVSWSGTPLEYNFKAWWNTRSIPKFTEGVFEILMGHGMDGEISIVAERAAFFAGNVPSIGEITQYEDDCDRASIANREARWDSPFEPLSATFIDP